MRLAVIGTFYGRHENSFALMHRLFVDATRKPDEAWLMCETEDDAAAITAAFAELIELEVLDRVPEQAHIVVVETPKVDGSYSFIPYSYKINYALDRTAADAIVYLDNGSMPGPDKYSVMLAALEARPEWGAVYCTQQRTGFQPTTAEADDVVEDGYCAVNYTQVMHRVTDDRWTLDLYWANPDLADALFWRSLHATLGPFYPVGGTTVHDHHHIESATATL